MGWLMTWLRGFAAVFIDQNKKSEPVSVQGLLRVEGGDDVAPLGVKRH